MELTLQKKSPAGVKLECLVVFSVAQKPLSLDSIRDQLPPEAAAVMERAVELKTFHGKKGESVQLLTPGGSASRVLWVGLDKPETLTREIVRRAAGTAGKALAAMNISAAGVLVPSLPENGPGSGWAEGLAEGLALGAYKFEPYKSKEVKPGDEPPVELKKITLFDPQGAMGQPAMEAGAVRAGAINLARDLGNHPPNTVTPRRLAEEAKSIAKKRGLKITVLDEKQMAAEGLNMLLGVAKGSTQPPRLMMLEYRPKGATATLMFVGKGITFDSGGISIKPSANMDEMKFDMCGAAGVLGAMDLIAQMQPKVNVVGVIPAAENLPGGNAQKPGDIVKAYNGKHVEVLNTDAEGRLILGDALAYGAKKFKPDAIVDMATLTGACVVALGHYASGAITNNESLQEKVVAAGKRCGDPVWPLPAFEDYEEGIKSKVADIQNIGPRWGGTITAGLFLKHFVGEIPWTHLDIAGTAWDVEGVGHIPNSGATGVGVALLADLAAHWK